MKFWIAAMLVVNYIASGFCEVTFRQKMLNSTFRISGRAPNGNCSGTCFVVGKRLRGGEIAHSPVFITAAHVLDGITSDSAVIYNRLPDSSGIWHQAPVAARIRINGKPIYRKHPSIDVAAFYVPGFRFQDEYLITQSSLATENVMQNLKICIGDELMCLGFPYDIVYNSAGFPILRSGKIASYPITPSNKYPTFLFDFSVFPGNSGGPVYIVSSNRMHDDGAHIGEEIHCIMGLVTESIGAETMTGNARIHTSLQLGNVINSNLIKEFIISLPDPR